MNKKKIFLFAATIAMILATTTESAMAYFTTYATAEGGYVIHLGDTYIEEDVDGWIKRANVRNDGQPAYVRVTAFAGEEYTLEFTYDPDLWSILDDNKDGIPDDGYYYYNEILYTGGTTDVIEIAISGIPTKPNDGDHFNVIVICESTPVLYDPNGVPYPDWDLTFGGND